MLAVGLESQRGDKYVDFGNYYNVHHHHRLRQFYGPWDLTGSPQHFGATSDTAWGPTIIKITMSTTSTTEPNIWAHYMEFRKLFQHSLYLGLGFCSCVGTSRMYASMLQHPTATKEDTVILLKACVEVLKRFYLYSQRGNSDSIVLL